MRTYIRTHPWINFNLDLRGLDYRIWLLLGEAVSKTDHIAGVPLKPDEAKELHRIYLIKGVLATTAIEGNTLTEEEVREHLEGQLKLPPSRKYLGQAIDNIVDACNLIGNEVISGKYSPVSPNVIRKYNTLVLNKLPLPDDVVPGEIRRHSVMVGRYRAAPAEDCEYLLAKYCKWLNSLDFPDGLEGPYSILTAIAAHLYFVWIHPFGDGNGRTARLIEFRYLLQASFPTPAAHLLSNFYNLTRTEYYRQLDKASKTGGEMSDFIDYAVRGLVDQLREQLEEIRKLQWKSTWFNWVHERFAGKETQTDLRRKRLVLELSKVEEDKGWVKVSKIPELTPRLALQYANKTKKTLSRDLNEVMKMGLIQRVDRLVRANKHLILAFLPDRARREAVMEDERQPEKS